MKRTRTIVKTKKERKRSVEHPSKIARNESSPTNKNSTGARQATFSNEAIAIRPVSVKAECRIIPLYV